MQETNFTYSYVPFPQTFKVLLSDGNVSNHCSNGRKNRDDNCLFDIADGKVIKDCAFFNNNLTAHRILLFQDDFELCNPLGASKIKFKLVGVYTVLANLPSYLL